MHLIHGKWIKARANRTPHEPAEEDTGPTAQRPLVRAG